MMSLYQTTTRNYDISHKEKYGIPSDSVIIAPLADFVSSVSRVKCRTILSFPLSDITTFCSMTYHHRGGDVLSSESYIASHKRARSSPESGSLDDTPTRPSQTSHGIILSHELRALCGILFLCLETTIGHYISTLIIPISPPYHIPVESLE